jgi:hypothetical protein
MNRHRANPLMLLPGLLLVVVGVLVMIGGIAFAALTLLGVDAPSVADLGSPSDAAEQLGPFIDGFAVVVIGCTVLTVGRYLWRGARTRGWRDRVGRLLIIVGYLFVGAALVVLTRFIREAMADGADGTDIIVRGLITCLLIALPGVALAMPGLRMAKEEALMSAGVKAEL